MATLFGEPGPVRITLHVNLDDTGSTFDWDLEAINPDTGDLLAMRAAVARRRYRLGPELSRMLLEVHDVVQKWGSAGPVE